MDYGLSFHFEKSLSYKIYISMACHQYVCAHVQLSIPLQKIFSHKIYIWRSSLQCQYWVCVHPCSFKFPFWENPFLQNLHWLGLFPVYVHSCPVKYSFTENIFHKIYIGISSLQYVYAHVQLSILLMKILFFKIYMWMTSLQYVFAHA